MSVKEITICGGGSLAHAISGVIGANPEIKVNILTRHPENWKRKICVEYLDEHILYGCLNKVSDNPFEVIPNSDVIIIAVPHLARQQILDKIKQFIKPGVWVGSFPGFAGFGWQAKNTLPANINLFGLQRVPYVRQDKIYGSKVKIAGIRPKNFVAALPVHKVNVIADLLREIMNLYVVPLPNYLNVCFSRSNSVIHPARIYSLLKDWDGKSPISKKQIKFYGDWNDEASDVFLQLDKEMKNATLKIPCDLDYAQPVLQYYEVAFKEDLTLKMRSIRAMNENYIPLIKTKNGYIPDLNSYFFTEDISYGLIVLKSIMLLANVKTPVIDKIISWGQKLLGKEFIVEGELKGRDISTVAIPQHFGLNSLDKLIRFCST